MLKKVLLLHDFISLKLAQNVKVDCRPRLLNVGLYQGQMICNHFDL